MFKAFFLSLISLTLALTPFWLWFLFYSLLEPNSFWEKALVYGLGLYFFGATQAILLVICAFFTYWFFEDAVQEKKNKSFLKGD